LDLSIEQVESVFSVRAVSVLGLFWLQAHFPSEEWDDLLGGRAVFSQPCMAALLSDACGAGLDVESPACVRL
jgi:hypothetical protein